MKRPIEVVVFAGQDMYRMMRLDPVYRRLPSEAMYNQVWNTLRPVLEAEFGVGVRLDEGPRPDTFSINVENVKE